MGRALFVPEAQQGKKGKGECCCMWGIVQFVIPVVIGIYAAKTHHLEVGSYWDEEEGKRKPIVAPGCLSKIGVFILATGTAAWIQTAIIERLTR